MRASFRHVAASLLFSTLAATAPARAATLVYTNDVMGELEPCGCRTNPLGGMVRKANLLAKLDDKSLLQVDAGDLLFATDVLPPGLAPQAQIQAAYLIRSMELLGHDAVVPGEKDFALGTAVFKKLIAKSKIAFLAANLKPRSGKGFLGSSKVFLKKRPDGATIKIAVLGLVGDKLNWPKDLKAESPIKVAKREVPNLRKKADIVVLVTHQGMEEDLALVNAVKGIDILVGAHTQSFLQAPPVANGTRIYQSSFRNQYVGILPLGKPFDGKGHDLAALDAGLDDKPEAPSAMGSLVVEFKKAVADANTREDAKLTRIEPAPGGAAAPKYHTFPKCAECHLKQFDFWRKTRHANALQALVSKDQAKNKECLSCHTVGLGDKEGFDSVLALAETKTKIQDSDQEKVEILALEDLAPYLRSLHEAKDLKQTVKLRRDDAQGLPLKDSIHRLNRAWTPVQCENCHEPGREHPFGSTYSKTVAADKCLTCHTAQQAPDWYTKPDAGKAAEPDQAKIAAKKAMIACPAGEIGEDEL